MQFIGLSYGWIGVEFVRLVLCVVYLLLHFALSFLQELLITVSIDAVCDSHTSVDLAGLLKIQLFVCVALSGIFSFNWLFIGNYSCIHTLPMQRHSLCIEFAFLSLASSLCPRLHRLGNAIHKNSN